MSFLERFSSLWGANVASRRLSSLTLVAFFVATIAILNSQAVANAQDDFDFGGAEPAAVAPAAPEAADAAAPAADASGDADAAGGNETKKSDNYLMWMFRSLGWFFSIVFSLLSLTMVALIVINIVALRRQAIAPEELAEGFAKLLDENKFQDAYELAKDDESLLGRVLATGLARMPSGFEKATQAMEDVEQEETMRLEHQLGYLALIGNLAPMIGLFGTIATALFTTELGLAIALPALAAFDILKNRLARFVLDVAVVSDSFMGRFSDVKTEKRPSAI